MSWLVELIDRLLGRGRWGAAEQSARWHQARTALTKASDRCA